MALASAGEPGKSQRRLPPLLLFTDPLRTPDLEAAVMALPRGAGVVLRHFGRPELIAQADALARLAEARGLILLIGGDPDLADEVRADGVHLPQRCITAAAGLRRRHRHWIITAAAHDPRAVRAATRLGLDAAVLSPVFPSRSPSAKVLVGPMRAWSIAASGRLPLYALGGVNASTARRLAGSQFRGLAAVEGLVA